VGEINQFDIAQLRAWLHCQGEAPYAGGQRMPGGAVAFLEQGDAMLNTLAIAQGQPELTVDIPAPPTTPVKVNRHLLNDPGWLERQAAAEEGLDVSVGPFVPDEVVSGAEFPDEVVDEPWSAGKPVDA
jgi:hypothetical protein